MYTSYLWLVYHIVLYTSTGLLTVCSKWVFSEILRSTSHGFWKQRDFNLIARWAKCSQGGGAFPTKLIMSKGALGLSSIFLPFCKLYFSDIFTWNSFHFWANFWVGSRIVLREGEYFPPSWLWLGARAGRGGDSDQYEAAAVPRDEHRSRFQTLGCHTILAAILGAVLGAIFDTIFCTVAQTW